MSTLISTLIKSPDFIEAHLSQCHGAILPKGDILDAFAKRINADKPERPVSPSYAAIRMAEAGIHGEAMLNWFFFFCETAGEGDFAGFWFYSLRSVEKAVDTSVYTMRESG